MIYPSFDRNNRTLLFSTNNPEFNGNNPKYSLDEFIRPTLLNKHLLRQLTQHHPKSVQAATQMLHSLNYSPNNDLEIVWENDEICSPETAEWLGVDEIYKQIKPITKIGQNHLKEQFWNCSTNRSEIQRSQDLIEAVMDRSEQVRVFLQQLTVPSTFDTFEGILRGIILSSELGQFLEKYFKNDPMSFQLRQEQADNSKILETIWKKIDFEKIDSNDCVAYWFRDAADELIERIENTKSQFEMLVHDFKRRSTPTIRLDSKSQSCIVPKGQSLKNLTNHSIKKYTKGEIFFTTPELGELFVAERQIEEEITTFVSDIAAEWTVKTAATRSILERLDVAAAFATYMKSTGKQWAKPSIGPLQLIQGWNPLVENCRQNDLCVKQPITLLTGFNSAGKSTMLRTVGLCAYLNQVGFFVPSANYSGNYFKKIYSRAGAEDDLAASTSTFTSQMLEIAQIIRNDDMSDNLVLLDELGANTNEIQGRALTIAILKRLQFSGATTLLATHFDVADLSKHLQEIDARSMTTNHNLIPYDINHISNGWDFALQRGFI